MDKKRPYAFTSVMSLPFEIIGSILSFVNEVSTFQKCLLLSRSLLDFILSEQADTVASGLPFRLRDPFFFTRARGQDVDDDVDDEPGLIPDFDHPPRVRDDSTWNFDLIPLTYVQRLVIPFLLSVVKNPTCTIREAFPNLRSLELNRGTRGDFATSIFEGISSLRRMESLMIWGGWGSSLDSEVLYREGYLRPFPPTLRSVSFAHLKFSWDERDLPPGLKKLHVFQQSLPKFVEEGDPIPSWRNSLTHLYIEHAGIPGDRLVDVRPASSGVGLERDEVAQPLLRSFPNLQVLVLRNVHNIVSGPWFFHGLQNAADLRKVEISRCPGLHSREKSAVILALGGQSRVDQLEKFSFVPARVFMGKMRAPSPFDFPHHEWQ